MKFVKISHVCLRGLIQLRNDLVYYISSNKLPTELKNEERVCKNCPQLQTCSLLRSKNDCGQESIQVYDNSISYLNESHRQFFHKWYQMLEFEFGANEYKQFDAGELIWWKSKKELESLGFSVFDLKLDVKNITFNSTSDCGELSTERFFLFDFVKKTGSNSILFRIH